MAELRREYCRACRDNDRTTIAEFIIWGKLFPPQAFGPRCWNHAAPWFDISRVGQYAVYDLRPVNAAIDAMAAAAGSGGGS